MTVRHDQFLLEPSNFATERLLPHDDSGQGTSVPRIIAGSGDNLHGARPGVAPGVHLVGHKVLDVRGAGHVSDVVGALDRRVDTHAACNSRVIDPSVDASMPETTARAATTGGEL